MNMILLLVFLLIQLLNVQCQISMKDLLLELNMTMIELFPNLHTYNSTSLEAENSYTYTYKISSALFQGPSFDNSGSIKVTGCSGLQNVNYCGSGECRNNPSTQCCKNCGPIPSGSWLISSMITYHNMPYCYALTPIGTEKCPERDGFLIHGGDGTTCSAGNPSDGCIVIESESIRYKIKGGGQVNVSN